MISLALALDPEVDANEIIYLLTSSTKNCRNRKVVSGESGRHRGQQLDISLRLLGRPGVQVVGRV